MNFLVLFFEDSGTVSEATSHFDQLGPFEDASDARWAAVDFISKIKALGATEVWYSLIVVPPVPDLDVERAVERWNSRN